MFYASCSMLRLMHLEIEHLNIQALKVSLFVAVEKDLIVLICTPGGLKKCGQQGPWPSWLFCHCWFGCTMHITACVPGLSASSLHTNSENFGQLDVNFKFPRHNLQSCKFPRHNPQSCFENAALLLVELCRLCPTWRDPWHTVFIYS